MSFAYPNHQQLSVLCLVSEMIFHKDKSNSKDCESDSWYHEGFKNEFTGKAFIKKYVLRQVIFKGINIGA